MDERVCKSNLDKAWHMANVRHELLLSFFFLWREGLGLGQRGRVLASLLSFLPCLMPDITIKSMLSFPLYPHKASESFSTQCFRKQLPKTAGKGMLKD